VAKENLPSKVFIGECELGTTVLSFGPKKVYSQTICADLSRRSTLRPADTESTSAIVADVHELITFPNSI
jgi:hypothetical protein